MSKLVKPSLSSLFSNNQLCPACINRFQVHFYERKIEGVSVLSLYLYEETFKEALYRFKGRGDIILADIFLNNYRVYLKLKYWGNCLVPIPSSRQSDIERGFNHVLEVFKPLGLEMINCLAKKVDFKQSDLGFDERQEVINKLLVIDGSKISGRKIVIVDDLFTTGATVKAAIKLLRPFQPKSIKVLTLAYTKIKGNYVDGLEVKTRGLKR